MIANSDQRTQHTVLHTVRYWVMTMFEADVSDDVEKVVKRIRESPAVGGHHFLFEGILLCYLVGINLLAINTLVAMMSKASWSSRSRCVSASSDCPSARASGSVTKA